MYMDSAQRDASKEPQETHAEATTKHDEHDLPTNRNTPENDQETSSSSSTSSIDSEEDFFQLDSFELNRALASSSDNLEFGIQSQSSKHGPVNPSEQLPMGGRPFSPDVSGARQSPQVQVMARNDIPDPNRIPSSIFDRSKSSTPMEWSVASNESLFSIHAGNSSFSRDHAILMGRSGDLGSTPPLSPLGRSGELGSTPPISPYAKSGELGSTPPMSPYAKSGELGGKPPISPFSKSGELRSTPPVHPLATSSSPVKVDVAQGLAQPGVAAAANAEAMKDVMRTAAEGHADKGEPPEFLSNSISRISDGSANSFNSFAFPILTGEERSGSVKVEPEPQQQPKSEQLPQPPPSETPKADPPAAENKWFPCFSCCSFCC